MKPASLLAVLVFVLVAIFHLLRIVLQVPVVVAGTEVPLWASAVALVVAAVLALALWQESRPSRDPSVTR